MEVQGVAGLHDCLKPWTFATSFGVMILLMVATHSRVDFCGVFDMLLTMLLAVPTTMVTIPVRPIWHNQLVWFNNVAVDFAIRGQEWCDVHAFWDACRPLHVFCTSFDRLLLEKGV